MIFLPVNALAIAPSLIFPQTKGPAGSPQQGQEKVEKKRIQADSRNQLMAPPAALFGAGNPQGPVFDCSENLKLYVKIKAGD